MLSENEILEMRKKSCYMCGEVSEEGNFIIGYDKTDVDKVLLEHYKYGTVLCNDCLFK